MLAHTYNIIIGRGVGEPGYYIEVIDGLNATEKSFFSMLMTTLQLNVEEDYYTQTVMYTSSVKKDIIIAR